MQVTVELDGVEIKDVLNLKDMVIQGSFDPNKKDTGLQINLNKIEFGRDGVAILEKYLEDGKLGNSGGIWQGFPYKMILSEGSDSLVLIDGYVDLATKGVEFLCDLINADIVRRGGNNWLGKNEGFTYPYLASLDVGEQGRLKDTDTVFMPYNRSEVPNWQNVAMLSVMGYMLGVQMVDIIKEIIYLAAGRLSKSLISCFLSLIKSVVVSASVVNNLSSSF